MRIVDEVSSTPAASRRKSLPIHPICYGTEGHHHATHWAAAIVNRNHQPLALCTLMLLPGNLTSVHVDTKDIAFAQDVCCTSASETETTIQQAHRSVFASDSEPCMKHSISCRCTAAETEFVASLHRSYLIGSAPVADVPSEEDCARELKCCCPLVCGRSAARSISQRILLAFEQYESKNFLYQHTSTGLLESPC